MQNIPNRRERRAAMKYQGMLKAKSKLPFKEWMKMTSESIKAGKEIHAANVDAIDKKLTQQLEDIDAKNVEKWTEEGYTKKEIEKLREASAILAVRYKETWQEDKKVARRLMKEVRESYYKRKNG
jgi:pyruvate kinase